MRRVAALTAVLAFVAVSPAGAARPGYAWHDTSTGTTAHFRGLAAVSATTAWVSGYTPTDGVVMRTTDHGATWHDVTPPDVAGLQFRDIDAFDANDAVAMSIGDNTTDFRIYVTHDGGQTWALTFVNAEPTAFYDCMSFFNRKDGLAISDPPDGVHFRVIATHDGGMSWHVTGLQMPVAPGAFGFAASGECLTTDHGHRAWFGSGGSEASIFRSDDRGVTWTKTPTPLLAGPSVGVNGIAFNGENRGIAVGGDFGLPTASPDSFARSFDGGSSWSLVSGAPSEYRSGVTWVDGHTAIAVGSRGATSARTSARRGSASTTAVSTRSTAQARPPAGPQARTAASPTSPELASQLLEKNDDRPGGQRRWPCGEFEDGLRVGMRSDGNR